MKNEKLAKVTGKALKHFRKMRFNDDNLLCLTSLAWPFSMINDRGDPVPVTSAKMCKVNMIGLYRLLFPASISCYTMYKEKFDKKLDPNVKVPKTSDVFCPFCIVEPLKPQRSYSYPPEAGSILQHQ